MQAGACGGGDGRLGMPLLRPPGGMCRCWQWQKGQVDPQASGQCVWVPADWVDPSSGLQNVCTGASGDGQGRSIPRPPDDKHGHGWVGCEQSKPVFRLLNGVLGHRLWWVGQVDSQTPAWHTQAVVVAVVRGVGWSPDPLKAYASGQQPCCQGLGCYQL